MPGDIHLNDLFFDIMSLKQDGYCCSQIVMKLVLRKLGRENPELVRGMAGLCYGGGSPEGGCGVLAAASCALVLLPGDRDTDLPPENLELMQADLYNWFTEKAKADYGGSSCGEIIEASPRKRACGDLLAGTIEKLFELMKQNGDRRQ